MQTCLLRQSALLDKFWVSFIEALGRHPSLRHPIWPPVSGLDHCSKGVLWHAFEILWCVDLMGVDWHCQQRAPVMSAKATTKTQDRRLTRIYKLNILGLARMINSGCVFIFRPEGSNKQQKWCGAEEWWRWRHNECNLILAPILGTSSDTIQLPAPLDGSALLQRCSVLNTLASPNYNNSCYLLDQQPTLLSLYQHKQ